MSYPQTTGPLPCPHCGSPWPGHNFGCQVLGQYHYTPNQLTEADIRRIIREELDRKKYRVIDGQLYEIKDGVPP